ncbi:MAG: hypothetical protein NUV82_01695 [Candidatus Komeilibacteria bacterium]|nr:hypothetical protein [Candidatus Komeilibacteria bacterium]
MTIDKQFDPYEGYVSYYSYKRRHLINCDGKLYFIALGRPKVSSQKNKNEVADKLHHILAIQISLTPEQWTGKNIREKLSEIRLTTAQSYLTNISQRLEKMFVFAMRDEIDSFESLVQLMGERGYVMQRGDSTDLLIILLKNEVAYELRTKSDNYSPEKLKQLAISRTLDAF